LATNTIPEISPMPKADKQSLNRLLFFSVTLLLAILIGLLYTRQAPYIVVAVMGLSISAVLLYISRNLRHHYQMISEVAKQIARGDYSLRIPSLELGEIDHLGKSLNDMLGALDKTISHLAIHREELRLVLSSIDDILWSQNRDGRIVWANRSFGKLFPLYDPEKRQYAREVLDISLTELIDQWKTEQHTRIKELHLGEHHYLLSGNRNDAANRTVFLMQNIDTIYQAEQMKKEFIVNLAHELRTPLTAIKGFSDAMEEYVVPENKRYLAIIQNHTQRLIHLIRDLEQLIRLEAISQADLHPTKLPVFFENLRLILDPMVEEKSLELTIALEDHLPIFECDPFRFEQIFINLVQNSLRYTNQGGITIECKRQSDAISFTVSDTGSGIDPVHLPRIFERFYVGDPSRNRKLTGTGLGLAIVKHIVLMHGGTICANSSPGKGTAIEMSFPLTNTYAIE